LPEVWRRTRLLPRGADEFAVESLPIAARFAAEGIGGMRLEVMGAPMLGGAVAGEYEREPDRQDSCAGAEHKTHPPEPQPQ
jgi:hypothetical protein